MTTIKLDDGKYEFDIDDQTGLMTAARRHGEPWEAGFEQRFSKAFMTALWRVRDLEAAALASDAAEAPEGWKLVPVEPTNKMLYDGHHEIDFDRNGQNTEALVDATHLGENGVGTTIEQDMRDAWAAMLASAPVAPAAQEKPVGAADRVNLDGWQLLEALNYLAPDRDTDPDQLNGDVMIQFGNGHSGEALYCWNSEYPDDGAFVLDGSTVDRNALGIAARTVAPAAVATITREASDE